MYLKVEGLSLTLPTGGKGKNKHFPDIVAKLTEEAPTDYKDVAVSGDGQGHYYASFVHDEQEEPNEHDGVLALDLGIKTLATWRQMPGHRRVHSQSITPWLEARGLKKPD
jgi:putative transposase